MLFAGQFVLRLVLPIWGFFAGFAFGAGLFAELADESFLGTALGWVTGFVFAVILALLAYFFYAVAVVLAMAAFGYVIGAGLVVALGIDWNWVAVLLGVAVGVVFGVLAVVGNMPMVVLSVASSLAGAVSVVAGADAAGGRPELRGLHGGELQRRSRRRLGLVGARAGAGRGGLRRAGRATGRAAPQRQRGLVRAEPESHRLREREAPWAAGRSTIAVVSRSRRGRVLRTVFAFDR